MWFIVETLKYLSFPQKVTIFAQINCVRAYNCFLDISIGTYNNV